MTVYGERCLRSRVVSVRKRNREKLAQSYYLSRFSELWYITEHELNIA